MDHDEPVIRAYRWVVSGRVQGVGFRWFVLRSANRIGATGWVRNLWDGRVEVVGQGPTSVLDELDQALSRGPRISVVEKVEKTEVTHEVDKFKTFDIN